MGHGAVDLTEPRGTPVAIVPLEHQEGPAEVVYVGPFFGTTVVTRHTVREMGRLRDYLVLFGHLEAASPGVRPGVLLHEGDVIGFGGRQRLAGSRAFAPRGAPAARRYRRGQARALGAGQRRQQRGLRSAQRPTSPLTAPPGLLRGLRALLARANMGSSRVPLRHSWSPQRPRAGAVRRRAGGARPDDRSRDRGSLHCAVEARRRRHGDGVPREAVAHRARSGGEDPAQRARARRDEPRAVPARGASEQPPHLPQHRDRLRLRGRRRRRVLSRDGAPRGRVARPEAQAHGPPRRPPRRSTPRDRRCDRWPRPTRRGSSTAI